MTDTIFGVIAQEEGTVETVEVEFDGGVAIEEAVMAIEEADKVEDIMFAADAYADKVETIAAFEEGILAEPEQVTAATAKMAAATTAVLAKEQGFPTVMSMEDDVTDPVRGLTVAIEEKRNIVKRVYDSVVIFFKKFVNMIKKAFAKVVMTLNKNESSIKSLIKKVNGLEGDAPNVKKDDVESTFGKYPTYTYIDASGTVIGNFITLAGEMLENGSKVITEAENALNVADENITISKGSDAIKRVLPNVFKEVQNYVGNKKTSLFGDEYTGEIKVGVASYTGSYVRCVIGGGVEDDKPFVKVKKIKVEESNDVYKDETLNKSEYVSLLEKAKTANKNIKKFTDSAFKSSNKALDQASKLAKTADKNDNVDDATTKLKISLVKAGGTLGYGIAMDRYKVIRETIKVGYGLVDAVKSAKKDS